MHRQFVLVGACYAALLVNQALSQTPDWSVIPTIATAPSAPEVPPIGCVCIDESSPCKHYDCPCVCDILAGQCDPNCCCDTECTSEEVSRFTALGACLPEGPTNRTLKNCIDVDLASSLVYVNPKSRMTLEQSPSLDSVLCIVVDNSPIVGRYLEDPGVMSSDTLSEPSVIRKYSYKQQATTNGYSASVTPGISYDVGQAIPAAMLSSSSSLRTAYDGFWMLPLAGGDGVSCNYNSAGSYALYRQDLPVRQCALIQPLSANACDAMSAARLVSALRLGKTPQAVPSVASSWISVSVGTVTVVSSSTGAMTTGTTNDLNSSWTQGTCTCTRAVIGVSYQVQYDPVSGQITSARADVMVADTLSQPLATCGTVPLITPVTSSVTYSSNTGPANGASYAGGNAAKYERAGQPGYRNGASLLAGVLIAASGVNPSVTTPATTDRLAIARSAPPGLLSEFEDAQAGVGFSLAGLFLRGPSASDGSCVAFSLAIGSDGNDRATPLPIQFGEDMSATCTLTLSEAQLAALCAAPTTLPTYMGLGRINASSTTASTTLVPVTHIGIYGNADPWKSWHWVPITVTPPPASASWDAVRKKCTGLVSGVDVELLTASVGSASNPQRKIIAARVSYVTDTWTYSREDKGISPSSPLAPPQSYLLRSTVTFTEYNAANDPTIYAAAPPVIPKIPSDLWYPFQTADDSYGSPYITSGVGEGGGGRRRRSTRRSILGVAGGGGGIFALGTVIMMIMATLATVMSGR